MKTLHNIIQHMQHNLATHQQQHKKIYKRKVGIKRMEGECLLIIIGVSRFSWTLHQDFVFHFLLVNGSLCERKLKDTL
jgi:hypothetical protein